MSYSDLVSTKLVKNIDWPTDYVFESADTEQIQNAVSITENDAELLTTTGITEDTIERGDEGMWIKTAIGDSETDSTISNYFQQMYSKLSCCLGKEEISVPILINNTDSDQLEKRYVVIKAENCAMDGINWYDDNTTESGHNSKCENLLVRLMAFLDKYDPTNEMIETHGGCVSNKFMKDNGLKIDFTEQPILYELADLNRSCLINECRNTSSYKRKQDRQPCSTTFCQSTMTFNDLDAANLSILGTQVKQECGANSALYEAAASSGALEANSTVDDDMSNTGDNDNSNTDYNDDEYGDDYDETETGGTGGTGGTGTGETTGDAAKGTTKTADNTGDNTTGDTEDTEYTSQTIMWIVVSVVGGIFVIGLMIFLMRR